jgi:hypothetical protein
LCGYYPLYLQMIRGANCVLDIDKLRKLEHGFATLETWFQLDRLNPGEYEFPVLGFSEVARDSEEAFYLYRDFFAAYLQELHGKGDVLEDVQRLFDDAYRANCKVSEAFAESQFRFDDRSAEQWKNLFGSPSWPGLTHESLSLYARKYEVEWPLRWLTCLTDIVASRNFDPNMSAHRDRRGRLMKGTVINHISKQLGSYQALKRAFDSGYSSALRNIIGHNDYRIAEEYVESLDGSFRESDAKVWERVRYLQAVHNSLLWVHFRYRQLRHPPPAHAGVVLVG